MMKKEIYLVPSIEEILVEVEQGIAQTNLPEIDGPGAGDEDDF